MAQKMRDSILEDAFVDLSSEEEYIAPALIKQEQEEKRKRFLSKTQAAKDKTQCSSKADSSKPPAKRACEAASGASDSSAKKVIRQEASKPTASEAASGASEGVRGDAHGEGVLYSWRVSAGVRGEAASVASEGVRTADGGAQFVPLLGRDVSRPLLEQFMEEARSASFWPHRKRATELPSGRVIETEMLAAIAANAAQPFMEVVSTFFSEHKQFAEALWSDLDNHWTAHGLPIGFCMQEQAITRRNTSSWHRETVTGIQAGQLRLQSASPSEEVMIAQVKGLINGKHAAEARTWSLEPEVWKPLCSTLNPTDIQLGSSNYATRTHKLKAARGALGWLGEWVDDVAFSQHYKAVGCIPDFDNAISTLAVRDKNDPAVVCLRSVRCITLAEVFQRFSYDCEYETMLHAWMEGKVVCAAKPSRGAKGKRGR